MNETLVVVLLAVIAGPVLVSFAVERLRSDPKAPGGLSWAPDLAVRFAQVGTMRLRYVRTGQGPPLVLLHTLRTQLDLFQKIIPELGKTFTVYAVDYPGHGWSDIPATQYAPAFFVDTVARFLEDQRIEKAAVAGVSIGATISLLLAARQHPAIDRVIAVNPYDYARGLGIARANLVARVIFTLALVPIVGETVMRFRNAMLETRIMQGGVADPAALPQTFLRESYAVGCRRGHYRAFLNLIRNAHQWDDSPSAYGKIGRPVLLVYGDKDWSRQPERDATFRKIPQARLEVVKNGGHFLPLDRPHELLRLILEFARTQVRT